jgi:hypothetical protein
LVVDIGEECRTYRTSLVYVRLKTEECRYHQFIIKPNQADRKGAYYSWTRFATFTLCNFD